MRQEKDTFRGGLSDPSENVLHLSSHCLPPFDYLM
jgi:hypothetical protein